MKAYLPSPTGAKQTCHLRPSPPSFLAPQETHYCVLVSELILLFGGRKGLYFRITNRKFAKGAKRSKRAEPQWGFVAGHRGHAAERVRRTTRSSWYQAPKGPRVKTFPFPSSSHRQEAFCARLLGIPFEDRRRQTKDKGQKTKKNTRRNGHGTTVDDARSNTLQDSLTLQIQACTLSFGSFGVISLCRGSYVCRFYLAKVVVPSFGAHCSPLRACPTWRYA